MSQKTRVTWYAVIGLVVLATIGVLTTRYRVQQGLLAQLDAPEVATRVAAARTLIQRGVLKDALPSQPKLRRAHAAAGLAGVGSPEALTLLGGLLKDAEKQPQQAAATAFSTLGAKGVPYIVPVLAQPEGLATKAAIRALTAVGQPAVPGLTKALRDATERAQAAAALSKIGGAGLTPLRRAARSKDDGLREIAIRALGDAHDAGGVTAAIDALSLPALRKTAIVALGLMGDHRATMALIPFLSDPALRLDAATALGQVGDPTAINPLLAALRDPDKQFHARGVWALQRIGAAGVPAILAGLRSDSVEVRRAVAEGLRLTASPQTAPALIAALLDPDIMVARNAALALGWTGNSSAITALLARFGDQRWQVAEAAVSALAQVGPAAVTPLVAELGAADATEVRPLHASEALAAIGEPAVSQVITATRSASPRVAAWAATTLGKMKVSNEEVVQRLTEMAAAGRSNAQWAAGEALRAIRAAAAEKEG